jgi:hypothetical protein
MGPGTALGVLVGDLVYTGFAAIVFVAASAATLCGLIHSPLASGGLFWPWTPPSGLPPQLAGAYGAAGPCAVWPRSGRRARSFVVVRARLRSR